mgnify:CR=1 FL=1
MFYPSQFEVNEAWIVFKANSKPIHTAQNGYFNLFVLIDAVSLFALAFTTVPTKNPEMNCDESLYLLGNAYSHLEIWPKKLFVPKKLSATFLIKEAEEMGIEIVRVAENQLSPIIGEIKKDLAQKFGWN